MKPGQPRRVITPELYVELKDRLAAAGYAEEYAWSQEVLPPPSASHFWTEYAFVVCNSGMKAAVAGPIFRKVMRAIAAGDSASTVFGHAGKASAIDHVYERRDEYFAAYLAADDKIAYLETLPWIGPITKWHLAKNFGVDCAKPDRHLVRLAAACGETVDGLCARLAQASGDRVATVDLILWRAASLGWISGVAA